MKTIYRSLILLLCTVPLLISCRGSQTPSGAAGTGTENKPPALIPLPQNLTWQEDYYLLPEKNVICFNEGAETSAAWLGELLKGTGSTVETTLGEECGNWNVYLDQQLAGRLGEEGYLLKIDDDGVSVSGATEAGIFYGIQTLRQMFPAEIEERAAVENSLVLRQVSIEDIPEFSWRGTMVDVARSFFGVDYLKEHIDRMALYKLNRLHLHLTDDQGWRIEIKSKPKLTEIGAKGSVRRGRSGFLTQEEYLELQDYALARNIIIIPEIDMPGHIYSALAAYPELNCPEYANLTPQRATPPEMFSEYNVGWSKLCLEKPMVYDFVSDVIGEMAEITKGPWIHIGGDEIEDPLYKEFVVKADSIVQEYGKTTIGWEEVTQAEVSSSLISQEWRGTAESVVDVQVIHSLCSQFYFDHANVPGQENTNNWCKKSGVSLEDVYSFKNTNPNVIGVEAPVWSEFVLTDEMMDNRFWPRTLAVAEVAWTSEENRDFSDFRNRLGEHGKRLQALGINFFRTPGIDWNNKESTPGIFSGFNPVIESKK